MTDGINNLIWTLETLYQAHEITSNHFGERFQCIQNVMHEQRITLKLECSFFPYHLKGKQDTIKELSTEIPSLH